VVVVDEAHLLDREMLEEVRFLLNFRMDAMSPMALILVGQTELWEKLQLQSYAAIRQRIDLQSKLYLKAGRSHISNGYAPKDWR
jgi:type II secretory pathway predicted ATPase ExeA